MSELYQKALFHLERGRWAEAETLLEQELTLNTSCLEVMNKLGIAKVNLGRRSEAKRLFLEIINNDPRYAPAYNNLGNLALEAGQEAEAMMYYQKAIEYDPEFSSPHNNMAVIYKKQGRYDLFVKEMRTAHRLIGKGKGRNSFRKIMGMLTGQSH